MEAFRGRGKLDYLASHDLEDFIAVIEGRETVVEDIAAAPQELREYLVEAAQMLLAEYMFLDVLPGFVLEHDRVPIIEGRLETIAAL